MLQKIFSDEFAVISTWTGRGKNISITIGSSEVIKLIKSYLIYYITNQLHINIYYNIQKQ